MPAVSPLEQALLQTAEEIVVPVGHPQLWLGAGAALIPVRFVAAVTALEIALLFHPCSSAYCAPAWAAC